MIAGIAGARKRVTPVLLKAISNLIKGAVLSPALVIPGVSGGTMALILGIYGRLISALHSFSLSTLKETLGLLGGADRKARLKTLWDRHDMKFLLTLLAGAVISVFPCMLLINYLFEDHRQATQSFFLGLVALSIIFPLRLMERKSAIELLCALGAITIVVSLGINQDRLKAEKENAGPAVTATAESPGFESAPAPDHTIGNCVRYALSGVVASSAMLLPGISGSFLLLLLGIYQDVVAFLNPLSPDFDLLLTAIFLAGCVIGLVLFARLINFLLERCHSPTMAFLGGLMMGSLWTLWPFRSAESYRPGWPGEEDSAMGMSLIAFLAGAAIIAAFARYGRDPKSTEGRSRGKAEA